MMLKIVIRNSESKISILIYSIFIEYVGRLDVSMDISGFVDIVISNDELPHDFDGLVIREGFSLLDYHVHIALAEFSDEVGIVSSCVDIEEVEDMFGHAESLEG